VPVHKSDSKYTFVFFKWKIKFTDEKTLSEILWSIISIDNKHQ
jgi:hypothetical protein